MSTLDLKMALKEIDYCIENFNLFSQEDNYTTIKDLNDLKERLDKLSTMISDMNLSKHTKELIKPGEYIYKIFQDVGITIKNSESIISTVEWMIFSISSKPGTIKSQGRFGLSLFQDILGILFSSPISTDNSLLKNYKVNIFNKGAHSIQRFCI
jgi:hypothetical protein